MSVQNVALVLGGLGISGQNLIRYLESTGRWRVKAVSRRAPNFQTQAQFISLDLLDPAALATRADFFSHVTHVFFTAYQEHKTAHDLSKYNVAMLRNTMEAVERAAKTSGTSRSFREAKPTGRTLGFIRPQPRKPTRAKEMHLDSTEAMLKLFQSLREEHVIP